MKNKDVINIIDKFAPQSLAEEWDRVGLMLGSASNECTGVVTCLDLTMDVAKLAVKKGCNFIITHHPFIWDPIKTMDQDETKGELIGYLFKNDILVYSAHTNADITEGGISYSLAKMFGGTSLEKRDLGYLFKVEKTTVKDLAKVVKEKLNDPTVKYVTDGKKKVTKVFVVSGAGFDDETYAIAKEEADCFITGDIKHHNLLAAQMDNFPVIEYSHFYSEVIVEDIFASVLKDVNVKVIKANEKSPFNMVED